MKKLLVLVLVAAILLPAVALAEWYPFGLTSESSYEDVCAKVKELAGQPERETLSYTLITPAGFKLYNMDVTQIIVNKPSGTDWRLTIVLDTMSNTYKIYDVYEALAERLGEPVSVTPTIKNASFDGEITESSPFASKEDLTLYYVNHRPTEYRVEFENVIMQVQVTDFYDDSMSLFISNPAD